MKRVLTALALMPVVAWVVVWSPIWVFLIVLTLVACLCYHEYNAAAGGYGHGQPGIAGYIAGVALLLLGQVHWAAVAAFAVVALVLVMRDDDLGDALPRAGMLVIGVAYIFGCWACARPLREAYSPHWLMYVLLLNWAGDIGAYYVGRTFGRHKLAPRVSPGKSWEGAVASVVFSVLIGGAYIVWALPAVPLWKVLSLTAAADMAGQIGDLAESTIKRGAQVKDSGSLLPGHGGMLDRVDSTLFALPVVYGFLLLFT
jgi:phosphatidate cytidylyltransferase